MPPQTKRHKLFDYFNFFGSLENTSIKESMSECDEDIWIFELFLKNIHSDIRSLVFHFFYTNIFRYSTVSFSWFKYFWIFICIKSNCGRVSQIFVPILIFIRTFIHKDFFDTNTHVYNISSYNFLDMNIFKYSFVSQLIRMSHSYV